MVIEEMGEWTDLRYVLEVMSAGLGSEKLRGAKQD